MGWRGPAGQRFRLYPPSGKTESVKLGDRNGDGTNHQAIAGPSTDSRTVSNLGVVNARGVLSLSQMLFTEFANEDDEDGSDQRTVVGTMPK